MKKITLMSLVLFISVSAFSQGMQLGIRGGINNGNLTTKIPNIDESKVKNGALVGVFGRASFLGFFVQPEISFSQRIGNFEQLNVGSYTNTLNYLDLGAMLGYSLVGVVRLNIGPTLMTLMSTSQKADDVMKDANYGTDYYNTTVWGVQAGVGFDLGKICVDLRYDTNLSDVGKNNVNSAKFGPGTNYNSSFGLFQFTLGYKIIKL